MPRDLLPVLVVGAGLAGLTAANRALELGLRVGVLERSIDPKHICASRANGGVFHVGFRSVTADPDELFRVIRKATGGYGAAEVAAALAGNAGRSIQWLESLGTEFTHLEPDDGWKDRVLAPTGFHDKTTMAWQGLGADRLIDRLERRVKELGGEVRRGCRATALVLDDGRVRGVVVQGPAGEETLAARAVVIADGGFEANKDMLRRYISPHPENLLLRGCESGNGDGISMAQTAGASILGMEYFYGHLLSADSLKREGLSPFPFLDFLASSGMLLDDNGDRFVDETAGGHTTSNALARRGSGLGLVIFDHAMWQGTGRFFFCPPNPNLVTAGGTLHQAGDIETLSRQTGLAPQKLARQVTLHNAQVAARLERAQASAQGSAGMTVYAKGKFQHEPFAHPPFYAAPACAALTSTLGGVEIDAHGRVLRKGGTPIPGLYAAGSTTGGIEGGPEVGYLGGLIKALVFGLIAAEHAASSPGA